MTLSLKNKALSRRPPKKRLRGAEALAPDVKFRIVGNSNFLELWVKLNPALTRCPVELLSEMLPSS